MEENKNEFHIQEYECGQKTNLYPMGNRRNSINLSTKRNISTASLLALFRAFFYPENYPLSNTP